VRTSECVLLRFEYIIVEQLRSITRRWGLRVPVRGARPSVSVAFLIHVTTLRRHHMPNRGDGAQYDALVTTLRHHTHDLATATLALSQRVISPLDCSRALAELALAELALELLPSSL
jgi:hypothetical protein